MSYSKGEMPVRAGVPGTGPMMDMPEAGVAASVAREIALVKVMTDMAIKHPRNDDECARRLYALCQSDSHFAGIAIYEFKRSGDPLRGATIEMAKEISRIWGNNEYGLSVLEDTEDDVLVEGWCRDLQCVRRISIQDRFRKMIQRKQKNGPTTWFRPTDERELRELVTRRGAYSVRNAILELASKVVRDRAVELAMETGVRVATEALAKERTTKPAAGKKGQVATLVDSFGGQYGVSSAQIEACLGKPIADITPEDVARMRTIWRGLEDGSCTVEEHFGSTEQQPQAPSAQREPATLEDLASDRP